MRASARAEMTRSTGDRGSGSCGRCGGDKGWMIALGMGQGTRVWYIAPAAQKGGPAYCTYHVSVSVEFR